MRIRYTEYLGQPFQFQGDLDLTGSLFDFVLAYGDEGLEAMQQLEHDPEQSQLLQQMLDQGLLEKIEGRWRLTPRAINAMQRKALMEVFAQLRQGRQEGHTSPEIGGAGERVDGTRPWEFGDPASELDLLATLRNTIARQSPELPLKLSYKDFEVHHTESRTSVSTVLLLDMSGSMARYNRFFQAKKCAMALIALIRQRFPQDTVDLVGFASGAEDITEGKLPLLMPKPVTIYDPHVDLRYQLDQMDAAPPHFTNLHLGLLKAKRILSRRSGDNKLIFIITDGQPTAHVRGDYVYLKYPPSRESHITTLQEAFLIAKTGVRIATFALTDDYWDMDWLGFVEQLGKLTRGVTFNCTSGDLTSCVMESYLSGRKKKTYIA